jgi:hypothetical protein
VSGRAPLWNRPDNTATGPTAELLSGHGRRHGGESRASPEPVDGSHPRHTGPVSCRVRPSQTTPSPILAVSCHPDTPAGQRHSMSSSKPSEAAVRTFSTTSRRLRRQPRANSHRRWRTCGREGDVGRALRAAFRAVLGPHMLRARVGRVPVTTWTSSSRQLNGSSTPPTGSARRREPMETRGPRAASLRA